MTGGGRRSDSTTIDHHHHNKRTETIGSHTRLVIDIPILGYFFVYTDKIWANYWSLMRMHRPTAADEQRKQFVNVGTNRGHRAKTGQMGVPGEV